MDKALQIVESVTNRILGEDMGGATTTFSVGGENGYMYDANALKRKRYKKDPAYVHHKKGGIACDRKK